MKFSKFFNFQREKADFEAVRAKLNATKEKSKARPGIKILDEFPQMPPGENGTSELVRKILGRKEKVKEVVKQREPSPTSNSQEEAPLEITPVVVQPPAKQSRFNSNEKDERIEEITDLGNLTAADLRKTSEGEFLKEFENSHNLKSFL